MLGLRHWGYLVSKSTSGLRSQASRPPTYRLTECWIWEMVRYVMGIIRARELADSVALRGEKCL